MPPQRKVKGSAGRPTGCPDYRGSRRAAFSDPVLVQDKKCGKNLAGKEGVERHLRELRP